MMVIRKFLFVFLILKIKIVKNITLIDLNGRTVLQQIKTLSNTITINTAQLQSGLYILNIKGEAFNYNQKIIKN